MALSDHRNINIINMSYAIIQETLQTLLSSNLHPKPRAAECCQGSARSKANLQSTASASHASDSLHSGCPSFLHSKDGANRSHSGPGRPKAQLLETRCVTTQASPGWNHLTCVNFIYQFQKFQSEYFLEPARLCHVPHSTCLTYDLGPPY